MLCLICVRSGSKGLKNKNILKINNKSLLQISIELAKKIKEIKQIVISTDSIKIAKIAVKFGAKILFLRPKNLSKDTTSEWRVWQHAINHCEKKYNFEDVIILPVISPLKKKVDIEKTIKNYKQNKKDCIITVCESHRSPYFNMVKLDNKNNANILMNSKNYISRRQEAPKSYDICTVAYVLNKSLIKKYNSLFQCSIKAQIIPRHRSIDIDDKYDFLIAKALYGKKI